LRRYLLDEPIRAKRPTLTQLAAKWSQRHKTLVTSGIVFLLLSLIGLTVATVLIAHERSIAKGAAANEKKAAAMARTQQEVAEHQRDVARYNLYVADMHLAHQAWTTGRVARMQELLRAHLPQSSEVDLRGWEWRYLESLSRPALSTVDLNPDEIKSISLSTDGRMLAIGGNQVRVWDVENQKLLMTVPGATTRIPGMTTFGCTIAWRPNTNELISAAPDNKVKMWDGQTGKELKSFGPFDSPPQKLGFSSDGTALAIAGKDGTISIFTIEQEQKPVVLQGRIQDVRSLGWSPDGKSLAVAGGYVELWDTAQWNVRKFWQAHEHTINGLAWSPDNRFLVTGSRDQHLKVWDTNDWTNPCNRLAHTELNEIAFSPDGKLLATTCEDSTLQLWDSRTWTCINVLRGHTDHAKSVAWSTIGDQLASGGTDGTIRFWSPLAFQDALDVDGSRPAAWSPNGEKVIGSGHHPGIARIFDADSTQIISEFVFEGLDFFASFDWNPTRNIVAAGDFGQSLLLFDGETGRELWRKTRCHDGTTGTGLSTVRSVAWNYNGSQLASAGSDGTVKIWTDTGQLLQTLRGHNTSLGSVVWSPDSKRLASKDWDQNVRIWDTATWQEIMHLHCHHKESFGADNGHSIAWSPDGLELAAGTSEGSIVIWNSSTGSERLSIKGHVSLIRAISWSPDGSRLASSGRDRQIRIWDVRSGRELLNLEAHPISAETIAWSPDGRKLASSCTLNLLPLSQKSCIRIWDASRGYE
jgi:WD40 repeat protein